MVAVLSGAAAGESMAETARRLHVARSTVDVELRAAYRRLEARNRSNAVYIATRAGYLE